MSVTLSLKAMHISPSATLNLTGQVAHLRSLGLPVISLGAGEPDFPTPPHIAEAAIQAIRNGHTRYTDACGILPLRRAIAEHIAQQKGLCYKPEEILVGAGAKQVLYEALQALINPGDEVLLPAPYWLSYPEMIRMAGGVPVIVPTGADFLPTIEAIKSVITPKTRALIVNSPNNPSGAVWPRTLLTEIMMLAQQHNLCVISDEIYENLIYDGCEHVSPAALSDDARSRTLVISGMSKAYAMTGWRVGYASGPKHIIAAMAALQSHAAGSICTPAQYAALAALTGPQDCVQTMRNAFSRRRQLLLTLLSEENLLPAAIPQGAFYLLLDIRPYMNDIIDSDLAFAQQLLSEHYVAALPGAPFGAEGYLRLSYAVGDDDLSQAVRRIGAFVRSLQ